MVEELPRCPITGKISYRSKRVPVSARKFIVRGKAWHMEPYQCTHCPYWHLTKGHRGKMRKNK